MTIRELGEEGVRFTSKEVRQFNDDIDSLNRELRKLEGLAAKGLIGITKILTDGIEGGALTGNLEKVGERLIKNVVSPIKKVAEEGEKLEEVSPIQTMADQTGRLNEELEETKRRLERILPGRSSLELMLGANRPGFVNAPGVPEVKHGRQILEDKAEAQLKELEKQTELLELANETGGSDIQTQVD